MTYNWYKLFNLTDWTETGLVSRTLTLDMQDIGEVSVLITKGNLTSILYNDTFLPIQLLNRNPFVRDTYAVYRDINHDIWLGIEVEE